MDYFSTYCNIKMGYVEKMYTYCHNTAYFPAIVAIVKITRKPHSTLLPNFLAQTNLIFINNQSEQYHYEK